ncbi:MAG: ATP-binding protein [Candidatus ainarchaeum sp.]|nr:ATP-binding protein [Candidatus ainarchaeum sp.]
MISVNSLRSVVKTQRQTLKLKKHTIKREVETEALENIKDQRILVITGMRRVGKSTLLKQIMEKTKYFAYVNFEDEIFLQFKAEEFEKLNQALLEEYGKINTYFFDEIQNIPKWEAFVRKLQDNNKKIILTGSNASLLSKELGTKLTGRYKQIEVYPFSFNEFLTYTNQEKETITTEEKAKITNNLKKYILLGGLPEYLEQNDKDYLNLLFENIIYRDIVSRYGIRKQKALKELIQLLAQNNTKTITYNSLKNSIKLSNADTVREYIEYLENSYLFFTLNKFAYSVKKQLNMPKKIFIIDNAFTDKLLFSQDLGRKLENLIFIELIRRKKQLFFLQEKGECDFIIKNNAQISDAIQVCYELKEENKNREINGLKEAMEKFKLKKGTIITLDQEETIKENEKIIEIVPAWKWLLE